MIFPLTDDDAKTGLLAALVDIVGVLVKILAVQDIFHRHPFRRFIFYQFLYCIQRRIIQ